MSRTILVTSFKGGVGKTTVSANLAMSIAKMGYKTAVVDCDLESRCLDMALGLENSSLYNICDVLSGEVEPKDAMISDERCDKLSFLAAPPYLPQDFYSKLGKDLDRRLEKLVKKLKKAYDYVIFDLPARPDALYEGLVTLADMAYVVCLHTAASIRAAEKTATVLSEISNNVDSPIGSGDLKIRLIINCFMQKEALRGERPGIVDMIGRVSVKLIGVIPYDETVQLLQEKGKLSFENATRTNFDTAIGNIAKRSIGIEVPLLCGITSGVKKKKMY